MNTFSATLEKHDIKCNSLKRGILTTLQVNMGDLCNQSCRHCHIEASPSGKNIMSKEVVDDILRFLSRHKIETLDITGGAPELNPHFDCLIKSARPLVKKLIVRSNLTVFFESGKKYLPEFLKTHKVHLICSMPCYTKENVDRQRGIGVFEKSIKVLSLLNTIGFSKEKDLLLDLVYNPREAFLPAPQDRLEKEYKKVLRENYGIEFNRLLTITNVPIKKFKAYLDSNNDYEKYSLILEGSFNPATLDNLMCRTFLSVGYDGKLYDCDFNLALGFMLQNRSGNPLTVNQLNPDDLEGKEIITGEHCLACTAGSGSSCQGALADKNNMNTENIVREYYGKALKTRKDLKTNACCVADGESSSYREILKKIHPEVLDKFYGCGSPIPPLLEGYTVLDLGCGTGRDAYISSYFTGEKGKVIAVDMTEEQLDIARKYVDYHTNKFGFLHSNIEFFKGYIENLNGLGIKDNSVDVVISNCVINLSSDKKAVFKEIFRVLKPGGELYFSDIFTGRRILERLASDPLLYGECLGGALYIEDFRRVLREIGCLDYRVVFKRRITLNNSEIEAKAGMIDFYSVTIRAFKLGDLEDICEDYGQVAIYLGTMPNNPHQFQLDDHHIFVTGKPMLVCGNTVSMLNNTRYTKHFKINGDRSVHYGPFKCGTSSSIEEEQNTPGGSCC